MFFQSPVSQAVERMIELHDYIFFFLVLIFSFVLWFFFNILSDFSDFDHELHITDLIEKENNYSKTYNLTHLGAIEVIWTIIPVLILTAIAIPSFQLLYALDVVSQPLLTLKCIGNQWYWSYECFYRRRPFNDDVKNSILIANDKYAFSHSERNTTNSTSLILHYLHTKNLARYQRRVKKTNGLLFALNQRLRTTVYPEVLKYFYEYGNNAYALYETKTKQNSLISNEHNENSELQALSSLLFSNNRRFLSITNQILNNKKLPINEYFSATLEPTLISFKFDSFMIDVDELSLGQFRLLEVDNFPILPAHCEIRLIITSLDVLHSFALPALGVKLDAIPGRLNQFGIKVRVPGTYFGQCSELCGAGHGFMPIKVSFINTLE